MNSRILITLLLLAGIAAAQEDKPAASDDWRTRTEKRLEKKINVNFEETTIDDALGFLGQIGEFNFAIDPRVLAERSEEELLVTIAAEDIALSEALALIAEIKGLAYDLRWGGVFLSTKRRLEALPMSPLSSWPKLEMSDEEKRLQASLEGPVNIKFIKRSLKDILWYLGEVNGVNIVIDPAAIEFAERAIVTAEGSRLALLDALAVLLYPRDFTIEIVEAVVHVKRPGRRDDWIREALHDKRLDIAFEESSIEDAFRFLRDVSGVGIRLDPEIREKKSPDELKVSLKADRITAWNTLELVTLTKGLAFDVRWGGVFVTTSERLRTLPKEALPPAGEDPEAWGRSLREALDGKVQFSLAGATVGDSLEFLSTLKGVNIVLEPSALEAAEKAVMTLEVKGLRFVDALSLILLPRGFTFELKHEVILVGLRE